MAKMIKVKAANPPRVGIWDINTDHPGGECFVADEKAHEVANTVAVQDAILKKRLIEVTEPPKKEKATPKE